MSEYSTRKREAITTILMCNITKKKFGARLEKIDSNAWEMTWAYRVRSGQDFSNQFSNDKIHGKIKISGKYPGCPFCKSEGIVLCCNCQKIYCRNIERGLETICPWCENNGFILGFIDENSEWSADSDNKG